jgi:hypothetical protein
MRREYFATQLTYYTQNAVPNEECPNIWPTADWIRDSHRFFYVKGCFINNCLF